MFGAPAGQTEVGPDGNQGGTALAVQNWWTSPLARRLGCGSCGSQDAVSPGSGVHLLAPLGGAIDHPMGLQALLADVGATLWALAGGAPARVAVEIVANLLA